MLADRFFLKILHIIWIIYLLPLIWKRIISWTHSNAVTAANINLWIRLLLTGFLLGYHRCGPQHPFYSPIASVNSITLTKFFDGDISSTRRSRRHLTSPCFRQISAVKSIRFALAKHVGIGFPDCYLRNFIHITLYHLLQILAIQYSEIE